MRESSGDNSGIFMCMRQNGAGGALVGMQG